MFHVPEYYRDISVKLSSVLEDVGVSKRLVKKRRRAYLLRENMCTLEDVGLIGNNISSHFFGSMNEGTTTIGLDSDVDSLICNNNYNVIEDLAEWKNGTFNLKMIQDENVSPGYCMLQELKRDFPEPMTEILNEYHVKLREDTVVLKNSLFDRLCPSNCVKNGPAFTFSGDYVKTDRVCALPCRTKLHAVDNWIKKQMTNRKISSELKRDIESYLCYIVPVGNENSSLQYLEWRISTSHAERCLMHNLNITQIGCYVLMKMILKTFLTHPHEKGLSSFICKNILLLCIEKTPPESWCASNLQTMITLCLFEIRKCIIHKQCPHFIERRNNLMGRKISCVVYIWLLEQVQGFIQSNVFALFNITIDNLGIRLLKKLNPINVTFPRIATPDAISHKISGDAEVVLALAVTQCHSAILYVLLSGRRNWEYIFHLLCLLNFEGNEQERATCSFLLPFVISDFGCVLASSSLQQVGSVSPNAFSLIRAGLNSDVASSRLKMASVFYVVRDFKSLNRILREIVEKYDTGLVAAVCSCHYKKVYFLPKFMMYADSHNEPSVSDITACCTKFLPSEIKCMPRELQYELFRSSRYDRLHKVGSYNLWMDIAVVDSLPYLYFLQYKLFTHLHRRIDQQQALRNLTTVISKQYENFGHRETSWNLAGQCMEQEHKYVDAFQCYVKSLNIRPRNNAANLHVCRLLYRVYRSQAAQQ